MGLHLHFFMTDKHLSDLERAATENGDIRQAELCRAALAGDAAARAQCQAVLANALGADAAAATERGDAMQTTVPCQFCGLPTDATASRKCNFCWEVHSRLPGFLRTEVGRAFVRKELADAERDAAEKAAADMPAPDPNAPVIDLMDALKTALGRKTPDAK